MKTWISSPHPISDIRDWKRLERLEIKPDFQRLEVWSEAAKVMLMDTIFRGIPMPKIFVASTIKNDQVHRTVIDGQQRISAILGFLSDKFSLQKPYSGPHEGLLFSQLPDNVRNEFLQYRIDFNEAMEFSEEELRETYSRLNKYSVALTKQELRRADFPGDFLKLSEELANLEYLETAKIFSVANRRRLADVEYVSEILAALIAGPQDKRDSLDSFYLQYSTWDVNECKETEKRFLNAITDISLIFSEKWSLAETRFRQKADFYTLVLAIDDLRRAGGSLENTNITDLRDDLRFLDYHIAPESDIPDFRDYAIKCVSQANTISSRRWRIEFLKTILRGTYLKIPPTGESANLIYRLASYEDDGAGMCPPAVYCCSECDDEIDSNEIPVLAWPQNESVFQIENICHLHSKCVDGDTWIVLPPDSTPNQDQQQLPLS